VIPPRWRIEGADWPNREFSRFVTAGGVRWHVQVSGAGPVVLLLHGTGAASHSWRDILPDLARDCTVVAPDLPGHGFTSGLGSPTLPVMARAVTALLAELRLEPALIAGHSAGAAIGLRMSLDHKEGGVPLVSFNGALLPFPGIAAGLFPAMAKLLFVNPLVPAIFALQARGHGVVQGFLDRTGSKIDARGVALYTRLFRRRDHVAGALAMMANWDLAALAEDFGVVRAVVRLVYGDRDATIPPSVAVDVAKRIVGSRTVAMPGLGHLAHEENPAEAVRIIHEAIGARG
jgi:magnesium chelatase accessory protein